MSLRLRVAGATTLVTLIVVALAGTALIALVAREERGQLDDDLETYARIAAARVVAEVRTNRIDTSEPATVETVRSPLSAVGRALVDDEVAVQFGEFPLDESVALPSGF